MLFESLSDPVTVYEVSPRDGLQNESAVLPTDAKVELIEALLAAGLRRIEVTSFVSPTWIPQLADAERLLEALAPLRGQYSALCPNARGLARARHTGIGEIAVFLSASEEHNRKNLNSSIDESLARLREVVQEAKRASLRVRGCVSTAWGFRSEQDVELEQAARIGRALMEMGCDELSLGDTVGIATPRRTRDVLARFLADHPAVTLSMHMHDTRGTALANVLVGLELGLRTFDAAIGGLGGCPYAPGASGNLATEDVVAMLHSMGVKTGIDLDKLADASRTAASFVGHELPSKYLKAHLGKQARARRRAELGG